MSHHLIKRTLQARLIELATQEGLLFAPEGVGFDPDALELYLEDAYLPGTTQDESISNKIYTYVGVYQVNLVVSMTYDPVSLDQLADKVLHWFQRFKQITDGLTVHVQGVPSRSPALGRDGDRKYIAISVPFWA